MPLSLLLLAVAQIPGQRATMSIEGVVLRAGTDAPLAGIPVRLERMASPLGGTQFLRTDTGSDGRFAFINLEPASYRVSAGLEEHSRQEYGSPLPGPLGAGRGTILKLDQRESRREIVIRLIQPAVITGRIRAIDGSPLVGMTVDLLRYRYDEYGQKSLRREGIPGVFTDDRGVYRMNSIMPGQYYLRASAGSLNALNRPTHLSPGIYSVSFYPGVTDESKATLVEIRSGDEVREIDFVLSKLEAPRTFRIRGRILDAETHGPPAGNFSGASVLGAGELGGTVKADGTFEVEGVLPGSGPVWAMLPGVPLGTRYRIATGTVNVIASDVDNVELFVVRNLSVGGRIAVDGESSEIGNIRLALTGRVGGVNLAPEIPADISPSGSVEFSNLAPIEYRLAIRGLPPNMYVKDAKFGGVDLLLNTFRVSVPASGSLEIVLSDKAGQVEGLVKDANSKPAAGMQAVLVPSDARERSDRYRATITDDAGRFAFTGVRPGDYKLFAWEALEPFSYLEAQVLKRYEGLGTNVRIEEKSKTVTELQLIRE